MKKLKVLPPMKCDVGCGDCCGIVPVTVTEFNAIERYIKEKGIIPVATTDGTCPLYQEGTCSVYPVRPLICKAFGHIEEMPCPRGYNVNVPKREVGRMIAANGKASRLLHELIPGFVEGAEMSWAKTLLGGAQ
jgi:uncharacterized protein